MDSNLLIRVLKKTILVHNKIFNIEGSKIGNRQFQIGNFRTEFGQKNRQRVGPILRKRLPIKKTVITLFIKKVKSGQPTKLLYSIYLNAIITSIHEEVHAATKITFMFPDDYKKIEQ